MQRGKASKIQRGILQTLIYADIFDYPLTREEIWQWLIGGEVKVEKKLQDLTRKKIIGQKDGYFFLKGREEVVTEREKREEWAKEKWGIAQKTARKLGRLPMIKLIGVTGALAMNNGRKEDDIDLLVVTSANSLWLTRLLIFLLAPVLGVRRRKPTERRVKNKICFNLFLEEGSLKVGPPSLFLAHEICQVKPLLDRNQTYERFLSENRWVKDYLPNVMPFSHHMGARQCNHDFIAFLNKIAFAIQYLYMKPRMTIEKVSLHQAFFHPLDLQNRVLREYQKRLNS